MNGKIPEGWRDVCIKNISNRITSGGTPSTKCSEYYGGNIPWLNTKEVNFRTIRATENYITELGLKNSSAKWVDANSIIVAMYGATAGKCALTKIPLTTNQACCNITIDNSVADYKFIYYALVDSYSELENLATGAAQQNLNVGMIADFHILLPPLPEQRAIASVLSSLDDKIDLLHRQNKTLEAMAETLFRQWFVEPCKDGLPEGWEEGKLGNYASVTTGKGLKSNEFVDNGLYPVLGANGQIGRANNFLIDDRLILTGRVGTLGKVYISEDKVWISDNVLIVKPKNLFFYPIYFILKRTEFENLNVGSTQPLVTQSDLKNIELQLPSVDILESYDKQCSIYFERISKNQTQIRTLEKLRDTLLPKLMSGEVRVQI